MGDERLRQLERVAAAEGTPESRAAVLRERLRSGDLARERVELAAYCKDEAAYQILGNPPGTPFGSDGSWLPGAIDLTCWIKGLSRWGKPVMVRAAVAAGWVAWHAEVEGSITEALNRACVVLSAAEAWLACPCEEHLGMAHMHAAAIGSAEPYWAVFLGIGLYHYDEDGPETLQKVIQSVAHLTSESQARSAIQASLVAWALVVR